MYTEDSATTIYFVKESNGTLARPVGTSAGGSWAFAVDYGDTTYVCVTWEEEREVHIGLVDIAAGVDSTGAWPIVSSSKLTDLMSTGYAGALGGNASDHWQIYAHGYHVITVAVGGRDLYLFALTLDASLAFKITLEVAVASSGSSGGGVSLDTEARTNDHHCVIYSDTNASVAVRVGSPIESTVGIAGHYVIEVNLSTGAVTALGEFGDATNARFNYESSAIRVDQTEPHSAANASGASVTGTDGYEWQVLACGVLDTDTTSSTAGSNTLYLVASGTLHGTPSTADGPTTMLEMTRVDRNGDNRELAMATQVLFTNGWRAVVFRDRLASTTLSSTADDDGYLFLWLFDGDLNFVTGYSEEAPFWIARRSGKLSNRPHATRFSNGTTDYLLVGFDSGGNAVLRAYRLVFV